MELLIKEDFLGFLIITFFFMSFIVALLVQLKKIYLTLLKNSKIANKLIFKTIFLLAFCICCTISIFSYYNHSLNNLATIIGLASIIIYFFIKVEN
ncbi:hypothetical protein FDB39_17325 [Clostridium botulinum]|nr:hypothetical protein [Clostridium botulinum]NFO58574.1 hypothetical protein [Clostridium botulinum]